MMQLTGSPAPTEHWGQLTAIPGAGARLAPWPIPEDSIIEGSPTARGRILARDGRAVAGLWECEAGRIELVVDGDEMLVVLEGRLVIQTGQGETLLLEPGDVACLPDGTDCAVTVTDRCRCAFQAVAQPAGTAPRVAPV
jgi:uncharacterized cupin superfamily protein